MSTPRFRPNSRLNGSRGQMRLDPTVNVYSAITYRRGYLTPVPLVSPYVYGNRYKRKCLPCNDLLNIERGRRGLGFRRSARCARGCLPSARGLAGYSAQSPSASSPYRSRCISFVVVKLTCPSQDLMTLVSILD